MDICVNTFLAQVSKTNAFQSKQSITTDLIALEPLVHNPF
jgi:hypothetical protein